MAAGIAILQGFYAAWAFVDPQTLAAYRGASIGGPAEAIWAHAYGSRTLFVALVVLLLLRRGDLATLRWAALLGLVMPVSDAWSSIQAAAPHAEIVRHVATAIYLLITFAMLTHALRKTRSRSNNLLGSSTSYER
jgi:hypothetical protein